MFHCAGRYLYFSRLLGLRECIIFEYFITMPTDPNIEKIADLTHSRAYLRQKITKKCNAIEENVLNSDVVSCKEYISEVKTLSSKISELDDEIGDLMLRSKGESELNSDMVNCEAYETKIKTILRLLNTKLSTLTSSNAPSVSDQQSSGTSTLKNNLKLPEFPLPTYSHAKGESLVQFFINFESIIDKYTLSEYERFVFLEKQLAGHPLTLIKSMLLDVTRKRKPCSLRLSHGH